MKRKFTVLLLCVLMALLAMFVFSSRNGKRRAARTTQPMVVTQDGKVTIVSHYDADSAWTIVAEKPKSNTNSSAARTNSGPR